MIITESKATVLFHRLSTTFQASEIAFKIKGTLRSFGNPENSSQHTILYTNSWNRYVCTTLETGAKALLLTTSTHDSQSIIQLIKYAAGFISSTLHHYPCHCGHWSWQPYTKMTDNNNINCLLSMNQAHTNREA